MVRTGVNSGRQHIEGNYTAVEIAAPDVADAEAQRKTLPADPTVKNFSYTVVDGEIYYRENSIMTQIELSDNAKGPCGHRHAALRAPGRSHRPPRR